MCRDGHKTYGLGVLIFGLSIACPLEIMSCSNAFSTPLEIVPEWYLIIFLCIIIIENVSVYSNPFRRAL